MVAGCAIGDTARRELEKQVQGWLDMSESIKLRKIQEKGITRQQEGVRGRRCIKGCRIVWHEAKVGAVVPQNTLATQLRRTSGKD